jgi:two-component system phosphate regulon response regulator PhoB
MNAPNQKPASGEQVGQVKLLIVDDDPTTCQLLALQLEMEGYAPTALGDPEQILDVIAQESPALVLVDYHLGTHDGLDLLQTIRNHEACRYLPVIVMSALDHERESESAGADGFVLKPFSLQDLVATIHKVLERQRGGRTQ